MATLTYLKCDQSGFNAVSPTKILEDKKPFALFLGGLLHFNKMGMGKTLVNILANMTKTTSGDNVPVYVVTRSDDANIGEIAGHMYAFANECVISDEARILFDDLIVPAGAEHDAGDHASLRQHLGSINIIGYSYGTSMVQQIETILYDHLMTAVSSASAIVSPVDVDGIVHTMGALGAVNIGPVARPLVLNDDRDVVRYENGIAGARGLFAQYFALHRHDKISQDVIGDAFIRGVSGVGSVAVFGGDNFRFVCDQTGDRHLRRLGFNRLSIGTKFPFVTDQVDHEGHDLRAYTSTLVADELTVTYPSMMTAETLVNASRAMVSESARVMGGKSRTFVAVADMHQDQAQQNADAQNFQALLNSFNTVSTQYLCADLPEGVQLMQQHVADMRAVSGLKPVTAVETSLYPKP